LEQTTLVKQRIAVVLAASALTDSPAPAAPRKLNRDALL
jgi:hypothetical protein